MTKTRTYRVISFAIMMVIVVMFALSSISTNSVVFADEIADLENKIKQLDEKSKNLDSQLNDLDGKIDSEQENQVALTEKINTTIEQIKLYETKITKLLADISAKEAEIADKSADIAENQALFEQRVRAMYISNSSASTLTYILSAKSFSELLTRSEFLTRISNSDQELITKLTKENQQLNDAKAAMELQNTELAATKQTLKKSSENLASLKIKSEELEKSLESKQSKYMADKKAAQKQIDASEKEIERILEARANQGTAPTGAYAWPVPKSSRITSGYAWRTLAGKREFHAGIDIGAPSGTPIVAAQSGTVISAKSTTYGYGKHVIVDHGGGYATLYAHASKLDVKEGDKVKKGQTIARVGTTGYSMGNHLHFEVRVKGKKVNPMDYVVKP